MPVHYASVSECELTKSAILIMQPTYPSTLGTADCARGTEVECGDKGPIDTLASVSFIDIDSLELKHVQSDPVLHHWHL